MHLSVSSYQKRKTIMTGNAASSLHSTHPFTSFPLAPAGSLRRLRVEVPRVAHVGQDVELECAFPWTEPRDLYSIKWWRNNDQFYQYIPKNREPKMMFNVTGIKVDVSTAQC